MLRIETKGNWRQIGCQVGETFRQELATCVERYFYGRLDVEKCAPAIKALKGILSEHCPEVIEETQGMAHAAGIAPDVMLGYRFFNEVKQRMNEECSVIFLAQTPDGPLLGRNCDLGTGDSSMQICHVCRPTDGTASIATSYLGMLGQGLSGHGLVVGGASAHASKSFGAEGLPGAVLSHMLNRDCRIVQDAIALLGRHKFLGKGANVIVGDATGASALFEFVAGCTPPATPRRDDRDWQACTNFFFSPEIPNRPKADYLENAYARYGRVEHQLEERRIPRSFDTLKQLLSDIAQPGHCCAEGALHTAYSTIMNPKQRTLHLAAGNPNEVAFEEFAL